MELEDKRRLCDFSERDRLYELLELLLLRILHRDVDSDIVIICESTLVLWYFCASKPGMLVRKDVSIERI